MSLLFMRSLGAWPRSPGAAHHAGTVSSVRHRSGAEVGRSFLGAMAVCHTLFPRHCFDSFRPNMS